MIFYYTILYYTILIPYGTIVVTLCFLYYIILNFYEGCPDPAAPHIPPGYVSVGVEANACYYL